MILVVPKKTLTALEKKSLLKKGYVVIECEKPESVRVLSPEIVVDKSDLFLSALSAIVNPYGSSSSDKFVCELHKRLVPAPATKLSEPKKTIVKKENDKTILKEPIPAFPEIKTGSADR